MAHNKEPVILELASLPREQVGPFLILGLDKSADHKDIQRHWAERIKWARQQKLKVPLEDVNWAREVLNDPVRRIRADAASLNADTAEGFLGQLSDRHGVEGGQARRGWQPLDREKPLADYSPPAEVPDARELRQTLTCPAIPEELPAAASLLGGLARQPLDPWALELPSADAVSP
jgi:hypothetical protein